MMKNWGLVGFKPEHAEQIITGNLRVQEGWVKACEIPDMLARYKDSFAYSVIVDQVPIACAGVIIEQWNIGNAWALLSTRFKDYKLAVYRAMKYGLDSCILENKLQRVQCLVDPNHQAAIEFIECFGFECECRMRKSGPDGTDFLLYARVI
jgi:hypothetical protein